MSQTVTYMVTAEISNSRGIGFNADQIAERIIGWNCSPECEGSQDIGRVTVTHASGASVEWAALGGKQ